MGKGITAVHRVGGGDINVLEIELESGSPAENRGIAELDLSGGGLVMLVNRGDSSFIPRGDYVFKTGDRIILIAKYGSEAEIEKFFGLSPDGDRP
jgi:trk system potassium uptake protein TrkA